MSNSKTRIKTKLARQQCACKWSSFAQINSADDITAASNATLPRLRRRRDGHDAEHDGRRRRRVLQVGEVADARSRTADLARDHVLAHPLPFPAGGVPSGPGMGVAADEAKIARYAVRAGGRNLLHGRYDRRAKTHRLVVLSEDHV
jgi:hypothetical protein